MSSASSRSMADIASTLLDTLDVDQRILAHWPFPSDEERKRWFYTPTDHGGLTLHDLSPAQHRLIMRLLDAGLSRSGYVTATTIMGLENVLDQLEGWGAHWNFPRGRDPLRYFLRIFGNPGDDTWGWRIGGHHISVHFTIRNDEVISGSPCFLGADPAASPLLGGVMLRPLAACEDLARELMATLDESQRSIAVVSDVPPVDLVGANRPVLTEGDRPLRLGHVWRNEFTGELQDLVEKIQDSEEEKLGLRENHLEAVSFTTTPKGLPASSMSVAQKDILSTLIDTYIGRVRDDIAAPAAARVRESFDDIHFAWAGPLALGKPHYYRIHGPRLLAEYDNTTRDGNHVHTVWRDPINDFGADMLGHHRANHH